MKLSSKVMQHLRDAGTFPGITYSFIKKELTYRTKPNRVEHKILGQTIDP